ncbi:MAG TPA: sigma-70 family RNA polymerase sigma factor [Polyangiaceae bacterium]|jgi:RNA polymerase sigma-70 factor (ECF subfamily)
MSAAPRIAEPTTRTPTSIEGSEATHDERLRALLAEHLGLVWRTLRRFGVPEDAIDDAGQQVWLLLSRKLTELEVGRERAFLFGSSIRIAADARRKLARCREVPAPDSLDVADPSPGADEHIAQGQARALLDEILASMPDDLRAAFVLYELEELTAAEISELLAIPPGTVASRARRARTAFEEIVRRLQARGRTRGGR